MALYKSSSAHTKKFALVWECFIFSFPQHCQLKRSAMFYACLNQHPQSVQNLNLLSKHVCTLEHFLYQPFLKLTNATFVAISSSPCDFFTIWRFYPGREAFLLSNTSNRTSPKYSFAALKMLRGDAKLSQIRSVTNRDWLYFSAHSSCCVTQTLSFYYFWWVRMLSFEAIWSHMTVPPAVSHPIIVCRKAAAELCDTTDTT